MADPAVFDPNDHDRNADPRLIEALMRRQRGPGPGLSDMGEQPMPMQMPSDPRLVQALAEGSGSHDEVLEMVERADRAEKFRRAFGVEHDAPDLQSQLWRKFGDDTRNQALIGALAPFVGANPLVGPAVVGGTQILGSTPAYGQDAEMVKKLQRDLKEKGYYRGPIDGKMEGGTAEAKKAFDAAQSASEREKTERAKADAAAKASEAKATEATAALEAKRLEEAAALREAEQRAAGNQRFKEIEAAEPWYDKIFRQHGEKLGWGLGIGLGLLGRHGMTSRYNANTARIAGDANRTMATAPPPGEPVTPQNMGDRIGRVNEFAVGGQSGGLTGVRQQPFTVDAAAPHGARVNPDMPQASTLYQPNRAANAGRDVGVVGAFGIESYIADAQMDAAQERLDKAMIALAKKPNDEVLIKQVLIERESVALWQTLKTQGRISAGAYGLSAAAQGRTHARPNTAPYEREVMDLNRGLSAPVPQPNPPGNGWWNQNRRNGQFGRGHRP